MAMKLSSSEPRVLARKALSPWPYVRRVRKFYYERHFDEVAVREQQALIFARAGLDYASSLRRLDERLDAAGLAPYDESIGMSSQHWIFLAGLAEQPRSRVLEIGTFDGLFTRVLSALFPSAEIITCDLPDESPAFRSTYDRSSPDAFASFTARRGANLEGLENVRFLQTNSFLLPGLALGQFDVVWVDGGHDYPTVAWDACNAFHMTTPDAYILFDDLFLHPRAGAWRLVNDFNPSAALLRSLVSEGLIEIDYFPKRLTAFAAADPIRRKHVAVVRKAARPLR